ncbi:L1Tc protein [Trypanosoma cruzi]|nr:L1Tc protein [Trypanosoma cruzi]
METGQYTEQGIAPLWHTDLLTCFTTQLVKVWRSTMRQDTHRYLLCGTRPSDLSGKDLITQEFFDRQERIHLARAGYGKSELCGRLYWAVRDCTNQCRSRNFSPEPSASRMSRHLGCAPTAGHRTGPSPRKILSIAVNSSHKTFVVPRPPLRESDGIV